MEELNFKVSSGLKNIIGKELITNEVVAVFELVKNSYDAGSEKVEVEIDLVSNRIKISDSGIGMSYDDLVNKWLFVAYSEKQKVDKKKNIYVGAKGIGRFACDRLGRITKIYSKTQSGEKLNFLEIDWSFFENSILNEFTSVKVKYDSLDDFNELLNQSFGTTIVIDYLSDQWDSSKISRLKDSLSKLISPFTDKNSFDIFLKIISNDIKLQEYSEKISNKILDTIENKTVSIFAEFKNNSVFVELKDRGEVVYNFTEKSNKTLLEDIKINIFYLNRSAKILFKRNMGIDTVNYGNIFIYKNNFRVYPFGEEDFDGFGLDKRKTQGYNRYIGSRELIGSIDISDSKNYFVEVSSRDRGFIENIYTVSLMNNYMEYIHKPLEKYVKLIKWGYDNEKHIDITFQDISLSNEYQILPSFVKEEGFDVYFNSNLLKNIKPNLENRVAAITSIGVENVSSEEIESVLTLTQERIKETEKQLVDATKEKNIISKQLVDLENQNSLLRKLTDSDVLLQAEITHHMSKSANNLRSYVENIVNKSKNTDLYNSIIEDLSNIKGIAAKLNVFNDVILKGNFFSKTKTSVNLYEYFDFYIKNSGSVSAYNRNVNVRLWLNSTNTDLESWRYKVDVYDISVIIDNMISNVFDLEGTFLDIEFTEQEYKEIIFFSNTPNIDSNNFEKIFELGFSTKKNGTGIGLYHIRQTVEENGWKIEAKNVNKGVKFIITLGGESK